MFEYVPTPDKVDDLDLFKAAEARFVNATREQLLWLLACALGDLNNKGMKKKRRAVVNTDVERLNQIINKQRQEITKLLAERVGKKDQTNDDFLAEIRAKYAKT